MRIKSPTPCPRPPPVSDQAPSTAPANQEKDSTETAEDDTMIIDQIVAPPLPLGPDSGKSETPPAKTDVAMNDVVSWNLCKV